MGDWFLCKDKSDLWKFSFGEFNLRRKAFRLLLMHVWVVQFPLQIINWAVLGCLQNPDSACATKDTWPSNHLTLAHLAVSTSPPRYCRRLKDVKHTHIFSRISQLTSGMRFGLFFKGRHSCPKMNSIFFLSPICHSLVLPLPYLFRVIYLLLPTS